MSPGLGKGVGLPFWQRISRTVPWAPDTEAGLLLWAERERLIFTDAAGTDPADVAGELVGNWNDGSAHDGHLVQSTAGAKPALVDLGGTLVPRWDGADDGLSDGNPVRLDGLAAMHGLIRIRLDVLGAKRHALLSRWGVASNQAQFYIRIQETTEELRVLVASALSSSGGQYGESTDAGLAVDTDLMLEWRFDGAGAANADRLKLFRDGTELTVAYTGTIPASLTSPSSNTPVRLGIFDSPNTAPLDGFVRGALVYDHILSGQALADARAYVDAL